ncbi:putative reverse transcriptase domain-containing protein [Tanacetum coccineum]
MHQRRWIKLFSDYECKIRYHPGKENLVADALSRKEWVKPRRVRAIVMNIQSRVREMIQVAQSEAIKQENVLAESLHGLDQQIGRKEDESLYFMDRIWVPLVGGVRTIIMDEAHNSKYSVHPGADKMYHDLRDMYWWSGNEEGYCCLPRTRSGYDVIWVIVDRLTKLAYFLAIREDYNMEKLASAKFFRDALDMSTTYHPQTDGQSERIIQTLQDMLRACVIDFGGSWDVHLPLAEFSYNNNYHSSISLIGPELVQEMTDKVVLIKEKLKAARDHQKSYANNRRKPLEFKVGDRVMLKVSPWKGVIRFGKKYFLDEGEVYVVGWFFSLGVVMLLFVPLCGQAKLLAVRYLVKVCWNSKRGPEFAWEREDYMKSKYP